jgi:DNA-binding FrmR family transcriptional regulator
MLLVKEPEMTEKKVAAIRRMKRYEGQMEALEKTAALHYVIEKKELLV